METNETPAAKAAATAVSPYVGPRPFAIDERDRFYGRAREIDELTALVISNPMVLFYAQSGAGKSSLVNAGLLPELEKEDFEALPPVRVGLPSSEIPEGVVNIFVFNALNQWRSRPTISPTTAPQGEMPNPTLEELATMTLADYLALRPRSADDYEIPMPRVVVFDQFEEIFRAYPERWREREPFFKQVRAMLDADPLLRVVFVMREDYIAELDPFAAILPDKLRVRFRLELLRRDAALSAVLEPLKNTSVRFAPNMAERLVDDLLAIRIGDTGEIVPGEFVEPVYLQVVCENLWNEVRRQGLTEITESGLTEFGSVSRALSNFYENCVVSVVSALRIEEDAVRAWFENQLITADKTRNRVRRSDKDDSTAGLNNVAVERLEDMHIIRGELQNEARWYELAHDRMIDPILRSNERARLTAAYVAVQQSQSALSSADALTEIVKLISPLFDNVSERPAILSEVFAERAPQILSISMEFNETSAVFTTNLLRRLITFGRLSDGTPAVRLLLDALVPRLSEESGRRLPELYQGLQDAPQVTAPAPVVVPPPPPSPAPVSKSKPPGSFALSESLAEFLAAPEADEVIDKEEAEPVTAPLGHVYISYARSERDFVRKLANDLRAHGIRIWNDTASLVSAFNEWDQARADAIKNSYAVLLVASPSGRRAESVRQDIETARVNTKRIITVWADGSTWVDAAPPGFGNIQFIDARGTAYLNARSQLTAMLLGLQTTQGSGAITPEIAVRNPYKGLRAFTIDDANDFFGRDAAINDILDLLRRNPQMLAVIGASGSGKSSAVMAGLIPRLKAGALSGSRDWIYASPFTPGESPVQNLIVSLTKALPDVGEDRIRAAVADGETAAKFLREVVYDGLKTRLVLVVDQFEEIFTLANDDERQQAIDLLSAATEDTNASVTVLLMLRADFFDRVLANPTLSAMISRHSYVLRPMTTAELREAIEKPAALAGLILESGLVEELLVDLGEEPGALPMLQFTLDALFAQREGRRLTISAYRNMGGVRGALVQHAETTYNLLRSDQHREIAKTLFLRLIEVGANGEAVRRRVTTDELLLVDDSSSAMMRKVIEEFIDAHLLFTDTVGSTETITLSHEALIRAWGRLRGWIAERGDDLKIGSRIRADAVEWNARSRPIDTLYRGDALSQAVAWLARSPEASPLQRDFIQTSQLEEERRAQEAREAARRVRRLRQSTIALAFVGVIAAVLVVFALRQAQSAEQSRQIAEESRNEAQTQIALAEAAQGTSQAQLAIVDTQVAQRNAALTPVQQTLNAAVIQATSNAATAQYSGTEIAAELEQLSNVSTARRLVAAANSVLSQPAGNAETAALLAVRAAGFASLPEISSALNTAVDRLYTLEYFPDGNALPFPKDPLLPVTILDSDPAVTAYAFNPVDGSVFTGRNDGMLKKWTGGTFQLLFVFTGRHDSTITAMRVSPDGRLLLTGASDGSIRLWDTTTGLLIRNFVGHTSEISVLQFMPDRALIVSGGADNTVRVWDTASGELRRMLTGHTAPVSSIALTQNGEILSLSRDGSARRWTLGTIERPQSLNATSACARIFRDLTPEERVAFGTTDSPTCATFGGVISTVAPSPTPSQTPSPTMTLTPSPSPSPTATTVPVPIGSIQVISDSSSDTGDDQRQIVIRLSESIPGVVAYNARLTGQASGETVYSEQLNPLGSLLILSLGTLNEQIYLLQLVAVNINDQVVARTEVVINMESLTAAEPTPTPSPKFTETPPPSPTATSTPISEILPTLNVVTGRVLEAMRLRTGPGTDYSIAAIMTAGEIVTLRAVTEDGAWFQLVRANGMVGWGAARFIEPSGDLSGLEYVFSRTATPTPTIAPTAQADEVGYAGVGAQRRVLPQGGGAVWLYSGTAGEALTVRVNSTDFDTVVSLFDPQGVLIASNDDTVGFGGAPTTNSRFDIFLPVDGVYAIEVRSFDNAGGGMYVLALESDRTICGDSMCSPNETNESCPSDCN
jgi:ABC-type multidrug transport system fused ATPase/permease subunit